MEKMSLEEKLAKIKSPKLQNQRETAVVLSAIEETLRDQKQEFTPTGYFAALLALLNQTLTTSNGFANKELATSVVYLLDVITEHVPPALLRSKLTQILTSIDPALAQQDADAPLIRPAIGCLQSVLVHQDAVAWNLPQTQIGPRRAIGRLLALSLDHRPKIRKRAQEALSKILQQPPPSPSLDHPASDMCAATALHSLRAVAQESAKKASKSRSNSEEHQPALIHALQLIKALAAVSGGWATKRLDELCEILLEISKSNNEYLTMASFEVFESVFSGMAEELSATKVSRLLEVVIELKPFPNDLQLLPPWIAVLSRGFDVSAQLNPEDTFAQLPDIFEMVSVYLTSMAHNVRVSASECLISFCANCIPSNVILDPSMYDEKTLEKIGKVVLGFLSVKYQSAWMETFTVFSALFETLKWRATPMLDEVISTIGDLRASESFQGKSEADTVLAKAIEAVGPETVLRILPLNISNSKNDEPGRVWLLPLIRDNTINANLAHFRSEFVPLSQLIQKRINGLGKGDATMTRKIYETLYSQIWSLLPGYCTIPSDLQESFDVGFAEQISKLLYDRPDLRVDLCKGLQLLVETSEEIASISQDATDLILQRRVTQETAKKNIIHLSLMAESMLAVLFNIYSATLPQHRGHILQCINAYLSIIPKPELDGAFSAVTKQLEAELAKEGPQTQAAKQKNQSAGDKMPPTSHALMDLIITMAIYIPRSSFGSLWAMSQAVLPRSADPQLQKKAYKLIARLESSESGKDALEQHSSELQSLLIENAASATIPARRDRLVALTTVVKFMPSTTLHFIPSVLSEVLIAAKETNEKARLAAFDLLVLMGHRMAEGGVVDRTKIPHMEADAGTVDANLEEYVTMLSAGLAGSTPHMISAGVTALARVVYEFHTRVSETALVGLVEIATMLLGHDNREVVRAVLGFEKVAIVNFPEHIIEPQLPQLVPALTKWSHQQKARLRVKVKGIFDRLIRRFGYDAVNAHCPEEDKKLLVNVRKRRERAKRKKKDASKADADGEDGAVNGRPHRTAFASEFDRALHDSDASSDDSGSEAEDDSEDDTSAAQGKGPGRKYIVEDADEPLDLLDRRALGRISSSRPVGLRRTPKSRNTKVDLDGKLILGGGPADAMELDGGAEEGTGADAYVAALKGRDAAQRGRGGRVKFKNRRETATDEMELELDPPSAAAAEPPKGRGKESRSQGWEKKKTRFGAPMRRGLEAPKGSRSDGEGGDRRGGRSGRARGFSGRGGIPVGRGRRGRR